MMTSSTYSEEIIEMKKTYRFKLVGSPFVARLYDKNTLTLRFAPQDWQLVQQIATSIDECKRVKLTIEEDTKKRSLDANAYAWVLMRDLAEHYKVKPIEVYQEQILDLHTFTIVPIKNEEVEKWSAMWEDRGSGWLVINLGASKIEGYTNLKCFRGSSTFDSKEMSRLIDNLVQECDLAGISIDKERIEEARGEWKTDM